jgi:hypothetical protein
MKAKDFVYLNSDIGYGQLIIEVYEVGIIKSVNGNLATVDFVGRNLQMSVKVTLLEVFDPLQTGDQFNKKVCNVCHKYLNTTEFSINQTGKNNRIVRRPSCKECRVIIDGTSMSSKEANRFKQTKPNLEKFTCPICAKTTIPGLTSKIVVDHDHHTGSIRGWLCDSCNTGLGRFKDNKDLLQKAIDYLESFDD